MTATDIWTVGETCYVAWGELWGRPHDIDSPVRKTRDEAEGDAESWLSWLSDREKAAAKTGVIRARVDDVLENGTVGGWSSLRDE